VLLYGPARLGKGLYVTLLQNELCELQRENFPRQMRLPRHSHGRVALTSTKSRLSLNLVPVAAANESVCFATALPGRPTDQLLEYAT